jgi:hypothetical protein
MINSIWYTLIKLFWIKPQVKLEKIKISWKTRPLNMIIQVLFIWLIMWLPLHMACHFEWSATSYGLQLRVVYQFILCATSSSLPFHVVCHFIRPATSYGLPLHSYGLPLHMTCHFFFQKQVKTVYYFWLVKQFDTF